MSTKAAKPKPDPTDVVVTPSGSGYSIKDHPRDEHGRLQPTGRTRLTGAERTARYRAKDPERARAQARAYNAKRRELYGDEIRAYDRARGRRSGPPEKEAARRATRVLPKLPCEICGAHPADKHHEDYSKPLDVRYLCRRHHGEIHRKQATA